MNKKTILGLIILTLLLGSMILRFLNISDTAFLSYMLVSIIIMFLCYLLTHKS
ncbi:hypothetical protein [Staphylococcus rostri]|uniref:hypothetical protein n=1 Tax=Staphylococcus rostri TaxID=522262 RepID=UPI001473955A|nr:hypothetical protein [Staphylococcus rostri]